MECDIDDPCPCVYYDDVDGSTKKCTGIMKECVGCHLEWCTEQPALDLVQFIVGVVILTLGHPFRIALTQSIYSKMLGPIPQVRQTHKKFVANEQEEVLIVPFMVNEVKV